MTKLFILAALGGVLVLSAIVFTLPSGGREIFIFFLVISGLGAVVGGFFACSIWMMKILFGYRVASLSGKIAYIAAIGLIAPWIYAWLTECYDCVKCKIEGDTLFDNDATCCVLFFIGLPMTVGAVIFGLLSVWLSLKSLSRSMNLELSANQGN